MLNVLKTVGSRIPGNEHVHVEVGLYARVIFYMDILIPAFGFALLYAAWRSLLHGTTA